MCRQMAFNPCSTVWFTAYFQLGLVLDHDMFGNRKPQARPAFFPGASLIDPVETLSHTLDMLSRDTLAGIGHFQTSARPGTIPSYIDHTA